MEIFPGTMPLCFADLVQHEPALAALLADVRMSHIAPVDAKREAARLVGPKRRGGGAAILFSVDALIEARANLNLPGR